VRSGGEQTLSWGSVILPLVVLTVITGLDAFRKAAPRRFVKCSERSWVPAGVGGFAEDLCTNVSMSDYRPGFPISNNPDRCCLSPLSSFHDLIPPGERISSRASRSAGYHRCFSGTGMTGRCVTTGGGVATSCFLCGVAGVFFLGKEGLGDELATFGRSFIDLGSRADFHVEQPI
jgi:hypothetical protein